MLVVLLTGESCVGKSTVAKSVGPLLGAPVVEEREVAHRLALAAGFSRGRKWLKLAGFATVRHAIRDYTVAKLVELQEAPIVLVDGAYDYLYLDNIRTAVPRARTLTIHMVGGRIDMLNRMVQRLGGVLPEEARVELQFLHQTKYGSGMTRLIRESMTMGRYVRVYNRAGAFEQTCKIVVAAIRAAQ